MGDSPQERSLLRPAVGTILWFFMGPGLVAGIVPWFISGWGLEEPLLGWKPFRWTGVALFLLGLPILGEAFVRFAWKGRGTPAPYMPTERLVITGTYRYVRNPMYISVVSMILGQGLFLGNLDLLIYAACLALIFHCFVLLYEEPMLKKNFGDAYASYCSQVRRWIPRLKAANPADKGPETLVQ